MQIFVGVAQSQLVYTHKDAANGLIVIPFTPFLSIIIAVWMREDELSR